MSIDYDLADLLMVFNKLRSNEEDEQRGYFNFQYVRLDSVKVSLTFNKYEHEASVLVTMSNEKTIAFVSLTNCARIRVLDIKRCQLEIIWNVVPGGALRCFLDICGDSILMLGNFEDLT